MDFLNSNKIFTVTILLIQLPVFVCHCYGIFCFFCLQFFHQYLFHATVNILLECLTTSLYQSRQCHTMSAFLMASRCHQVEALDLPVPTVCHSLDLQRLCQNNFILFMEVFPLHIYGSQYLPLISSWRLRLNESCVQFVNFNQFGDLIIQIYFDCILKDAAMNAFPRLIQNFYHYASVKYSINDTVNYVQNEVTGHI